MILSVENLGHSYGVRTLFKNISFNIEDGDKIGVIGVKARCCAILRPANQARAKLPKTARA